MQFGTGSDAAKMRKSHCPIFPSASVLVVAGTGDSGIVRWKKPDRVWELVGLQRDFHSYVVGAMDEYLR